MVLLAVLSGLDEVGVAVASYVGATVVAAGDRWRAAGLGLVLPLAQGAGRACLHAFLRLPLPLLPSRLLPVWPLCQSEGHA